MQHELGLQRSVRERPIQGNTGGDHTGSRGARSDDRGLAGRLDCFGFVDGRGSGQRGGGAHVERDEVRGKNDGCERDGEAAILASAGVEWRTVGRCYGE